MNLRHHLKQASINIFSTKLRSVLAVLGILIGTASVVVLMTSAQMATDQVLLQFKSLGTNLLGVNTYQRQSKENAPAPIPFTLDEIETLKMRMPEIENIAPYVPGYLPAAFKGQSVRATMLGITQSFAQLAQLQLQEGRFISFVDKRSYFAVIGHEIYETMRKQHGSQVLGEQIKVGKQYFTIIGVLKKWKRNTFIGQNIDKSVLIPISTSFTLNRNLTLNNLLIRLQEENQTLQLQKKLEVYYKQHHPSLTANFRSAEQLIQQMESQRGIFIALVGLIGGISLLVGGIGIMNIMLVSVTERQREIGLRKALGATKRDIRTLFLCESVCLSLLGGGLGATLGIAICFLIATLAKWPFHLYSMPLLLGFFVSTLCGVFFGFYPANRAGGLDPIVTLRSSGAD